MLAKVVSASVIGVDAYPVEVEVDVTSGLPGFEIVGLPDTAVREAKERVRAAIRNSEGDFVKGRITVNLAPADLRKEGSGFDLPMALGLLIADGQLLPEAAAESLFVGELSLDGSVRSVSGVLPMALMAKARGLTRLFVPRMNVSEALLVEGLEVYAVPDLFSLAAHLRGEGCLGPAQARREVAATSETAPELDFSDVRGQKVAKRALEIAAAGGHNVLLIGPPGAGKTLLARQLPGILPAMPDEEALEVTKIYSVSGLMHGKGGLIRRRPFRAPHHSISYAALIGGGRVPKPGEVSLSHNGVLFLDELPEFPKRVLEQLRQPLEDGVVHLARVQMSLVYPSRFMLVAAMNPCPCGFLGDATRQCSCSEQEVRRYLSKISGPLLDRIDIQLTVPRLEYAEIVAEGKDGETSETIRERVEQARGRQQVRFRNTKVSCNAGMNTRMLRRHVRLQTEGEQMMQAAFQRMQLSARAYERILKVARTIADLEGCTEVAASHVAEALSYRAFDRQALLS